MRPKPKPPKDRRTTRQRLDHAEAVETADWAHDNKMKTKNYHTRKVLAALDQVGGQLKTLLTFARPHHQGGLTEQEWQCVYDAAELLALARGPVYRRCPPPVYSTQKYDERERKKKLKQGFRKKGKLAQ